MATSTIESEDEEETSSSSSFVVCDICGIRSSKWRLGAHIRKSHPPIGHHQRKRRIEAVEEEVNAEENVRKKKKDDDKVEENESSSTSPLVYVLDRDRKIFVHHRDADRSRLLEMANKPCVVNLDQLPQIDGRCWDPRAGLFTEAGMVQEETCDRSFNCITWCIDCDNRTKKRIDWSIDRSSAINNLDACRFRNFRSIRIRIDDHTHFDPWSMVDHRHHGTTAFVTVDHPKMQADREEFRLLWSPPPKTTSLVSGQGQSTSKQSDRSFDIWIAQKIGRYFLDLCDGEMKFLERWKDIEMKMGLDSNLTEDKIVWKAPEKDGSREICDHCSMTILNLHLFCARCGLALCTRCVNELIVSEAKENRPQHGEPKKKGLRRVVMADDDNSDSEADYDVERDLRKTIGCLYDDDGNRVPNGGTLPHKLKHFQLASIIPDFVTHFNRLQQIVREIQRIKYEYVISPPIAQTQMDDVHYIFDREILILPASKDPGVMESLFREHWNKARPVIVEGMKLNRDLWTPEQFEKACERKGIMEIGGDVIDCRDGQPFACSPSEFWNGFISEDARGKLEKTHEKDDCGLLLKLKDFPSDERFADVLPEQYKDLCDNLPIPTYTHPTAGRLNLVTRLPAYCSPPDLGPKLYVAYEMTKRPKLGTTNLHIDVSDAVNILANVTTVSQKDGGERAEYEKILKHLSKQGLDPYDLSRAKNRVQDVGALWTIFKPEDNVKIRRFLNKVKKERGEVDVDAEDPIHDARIYLNAHLRKRLAKEEGVVGFTFVQMLGDAVFIPAGAAHQVQNLQCCIKVAEDFVSPEGVQRCQTIADEFRALSDDHDAHVDKLQLPNIVAHTIRECVRSWPPRA